MRSHTDRSHLVANPLCSFRAYLKMGSIVVLLITILAYATASAIPAQPNHLTEEDFARAALRPPTPVNATSLGPSENFFELPETKNAYKHGKWPNARIPYALDPFFSVDQRTQLARAVDNYQSTTCLRFEPATLSDRDYVQFLRDDNNCGPAEVCKIGGPQAFSFGSSCSTSQFLTRQLGQTICFGREHTRPDRDSWINFNANVCLPPIRDNGNDWTTLDLPYDYLSIQHQSCADGCILPKESGVTQCGSGVMDTLSVLDVEKINAFYECEGCRSYRYKRIDLLASTDNLVIGGHGENNEPIYSCRTYHNGGMVPGKADLVKKSCWVGSGGLEYEKHDNFEILTNSKGANFQWIPKRADGSFPSNAVAGGQSTGREPFYVARCMFLTENFRYVPIPGKIQSTASFATITYGHREYQCSAYEILVCQ